jgi:hypothetical protein
MSSPFHHPIFAAPIRLTREQFENPTEVLSDFFDDYSLQDLRDTLWQVVKVCLTTDDHPFHEPFGRDALLALYESLETALEASYVLAVKSIEGNTSAT